MDQQTATLLLSVGIGTIITILAVIYGEKISKWANKIEPDPEKGMKKLFIGGVVLWVVVGLGVSFYIMARLLGLTA